MREKKNKRPVTVVRAKRVTAVHVGPNTDSRFAAAMVGHAHKHLRTARKVVK